MLCVLNTWSIYNKGVTQQQKWPSSPCSALSRRRSILGSDSGDLGENSLECGLVVESPTALPRQSRRGKKQLILLGSWLKKAANVLRELQHVFPLAAAY